MLTDSGCTWGAADDGRGLSKLLETVPLVTVEYAEAVTAMCNLRPDNVRA